MNNKELLMLLFKAEPTKYENAVNSVRVDGRYSDGNRRYFFNKVQEHTIEQCPAHTVCPVNLTGEVLNVTISDVEYEVSLTFVERVDANTLRISLTFNYVFQGRAARKVMSVAISANLDTSSKGGTYKTQVTSTFNIFSLNISA